MESGGLNYELLLQEIEGVDDYWGPTFRYRLNRFFDKLLINIYETCYNAEQFMNAMIILNLWNNSKKE